MFELGAHLAEDTPLLCSGLCLLSSLLWNGEVGAPCQPPGFSLFRGALVVRMEEDGVILSLILRGALARQQGQWGQLRQRDFI